MTQITTEPIEEVKISRIIGHIRGGKEGPTIVFFGGIHGNEPSGARALQEVFKTLNKNSFAVKGNLYGINGNIPAQLKGKRYLDSDLNRLWTEEKINGIKSKDESERNTEERELMELHGLISDILATQKGPFYFVDLHTTSSDTLPFITINDALINRRFSRLFPVPIVLGIEEYLEGPLLSYINRFGYVSLGFESGQHISEDAVRNSIAFIWLTMVFSGFMEKEEVPEFKTHYRQLKQSSGGNGNFYEVVHRHKISATDDFRMDQGFESFDYVRKGKLLARHNHKKIYSEKNAIVFMPLYQKLGEEGFFLIRKIPDWALKLSTFLRKTRLDALLTILPGVSWENTKKERLLVNVRTAKFFTKPFFHLLGYRNRTLDKNHLIMNNRERTAKKEMYQNAWWYR